MSRDPWPPQSGTRHALPYPPAEPELSLHDYIGILIGARGMITAIVAISLLIGAAVAFLSSPVFEADALVKAEEEANTLSALDQVNSLFADQSPVNAEIEFLNSRRVLGRTVDNLRLDVKATPLYFPLVGESLARRFQGGEGDLAKPLFGLEGYSWGGEWIEVAELNVPANLLDVTLTLVVLDSQRYRLFDPDGELLLEGQVGEIPQPLPETAELRLRVSGLQAHPGSRFNLIRQARLTAIKALKDRFSAKETSRQSEMIRLKLSGANRQETAEILNEIIRIFVEQKSRFLSVEAEKTLDFLQEQLPELRAAMERAESALNDFRLKQGSVDLPLETQSVLKSTVAVDAQTTELRQNRDELRQKFTEAHPSIVALDAQLTRLRKEKRSLIAKIKDLPETQQQMLRLSRDVEVTTKLYTELLKSAQELRVAKASSVSNVQIIDPALTSGEAVKPRKAQILLIALLGGLFIAILSAFIRRALELSVYDPNQIEARLGIPVFVALPNSKAQRRLKRKKGSDDVSLLAAMQPDDPTVEGLRSLRSTLNHVLTEVPNRLLLVTGPKSGVGTSFVAANLGVLLASGGDRVCIIDADLRNGRLNHHFGIKSDPGLTEILLGNLTLNDALQKTSIDHLHLLPAGGSVENPAELLMKKRFAKVLDTMQTHYDRVILDSPPLLDVADAVILGQHAGAALLVVKAGEHNLSELEHSVKRLWQGGVELRGIVVNGTNNDQRDKHHPRG
ncbi:MAG: polysaccharide biosynthesis tyrosine autokinase [gamma proteobacterium endosymbiont of Lamellibrachia anaximandri]|nr:polysaccharide biosynthesis tyrosine autokinase [gamma proteobacterium endosymbiont of Lamellibrachia anaximandri]MBL3535089.1 polysaccharide biosynthesis tyrosine autokinase [gamma proteobacterium endosymbiont of Lamellibrachia anaximandri]